MLYNYIWPYLHCACAKKTAVSEIQYNKNADMAFT